MAKITITIDTDKVREAVEAHGRDRLRVQGRGFSEIDFFMGAGAVYDAMGIWEKCPPLWLLSPICGRSVFDFDKKEKV